MKHTETDETTLLLCLSTFPGAIAVHFDMMSPYKGKLYLHTAVMPDVH